MMPLVLLILLNLLVGQQYLACKKYHLPAGAVLGIIFGGLAPHHLGGNNG